MKVASPNQTRRGQPDLPGGRVPRPAFGQRPPWHRGTGRGEGAVALVITLILISVITFLAITFLALSRRERGQVTVTKEQTVAQMAADTAQAQATAQLLATILANTNKFNFGLLVSTNFINYAGYDPAGNVYDQRTNVNFEYLNNGSVGLGANEAMENLTHLLYAPRPPVYTTNQLLANTWDFRYYLDLNRDGQPTRTGWLVVTNENGGFYDLNTNPIPAFVIKPHQPPPRNVLVRYFTGDPEFVGLLTRPEFPHSPTNYFVSRYAFIVVPAGKTLDVNYIHNATRLDRGADLSSGDLFRRNQGVGPWENNLAGFLVDLNTNAWPGPQQLANALGSPYAYNPDLGIPNQGAGFDDALGFVRYRYGSGRPPDVFYNSFSVQSIYGANGVLAMRNDGVDAYALSPLMSNIFGLQADRDLNYSASVAWGGSEKLRQLFTTQDFFDQNKLPTTFVNRLSTVGKDSQNYPSSYDRYTYYRMLAELGTDSAADPDSATVAGGKLNLNFINLPPFKTTNYVSWTNESVIANVFGTPHSGRQGARLFFSNAVDRLVRRFTADWRNRSFNTYSNAYFSSLPPGNADKVRPFGADRIPVFINGRFVYPPSLHRQLQLAANLWDAVNPQYFPGNVNPPVPMPTVFRPIFTRDGLNLYITDFEEVTSDSQLFAEGTLRDLSNTNLVTSVEPRDLVFGVPLIIGVRKGLPNFNEFSSEAVVQITRKVELLKSAPGGASKIFQTNQMLIVGISNAFGAEFWNSYATQFPRPVDVQVTNFYQYALTNDYSFKASLTVNPFPFGATNMPTSWPRWTGNLRDASFVVPMRSNHIILRDSIYRRNTDNFAALTTDAKFERPSGFEFPRWGLALTNRVIAIVRDRNTGRIIDYVQLNGMSRIIDIADEVAEAPPGARSGAGGFGFLWATNALDANVMPKLGDFLGVHQQILVSGGEEWGFAPGNNWANNGIAQPSGATRDQAIANFLAFFENSGRHVYQAGGRSYYGTNTSLEATVPFTPTRKFSIQMFWQANDPLVHYTAGDMEDLDRLDDLGRPGKKVFWTPPSLTTNTVANLGQINLRYRPWGGYPFAGSTTDEKSTAFQTAVKDAGVRGSDYWQFPTNRLPTLGWLGRVHRGTPWQTVYLKSTRVADLVAAKQMEALDWLKWSGNRNIWIDPIKPANSFADAELTKPEEDRSWLELFTTALNEPATRGQLPINQSGLAAWSAVLSGVVSLMNTNTDADLWNNGGPTGFGRTILEPAGYYDPKQPKSWPTVLKIVEGINRTRANTNLFPNRTFTRLGDLLATPELSDASPLLNFGAKDQDGHNVQIENGLNDVLMEWLPQQTLSLVRLGEPRFVIYSFGQTLKPAPRSIQFSGPYSQLCTNYEITAEVATRAVVKVVGSPDPRQTDNTDPDQNYPPRIVVESFNVLPPD